MGEMNNMHKILFEKSEARYEMDGWIILRRISAGTACEYGN
jgi:hypothetical protein